MVMKDLETLMQGKLLEEQREIETMECLFLGCNAKDLWGKVLLGPEVEQCGSSRYVLGVLSFSLL